MALDAELEQRLRLCYPIGLHGDVARDQIDQAPARLFWEHVQPLLDSHGFYCPGPDDWRDGYHVVNFPVYRLGDPPGGYFNLNHPERIEALRDSGRPHLDLCFKVSAIVPALFVCITETWFNPDTYGDKGQGRYDDGLLANAFLPDTSFEPWAGLVKAVRALAQTLDLQEFDKQTLDEDVPFITHPMWLDDDPDDDTDDLSDAEYSRYMKNYPRQHVCCLYDCLFGFV